MAEILVVVDMQNDFVSGVLGTQEAFDIVPQVVGRVVDGLNRGETVLFTRDTHEADYLSTQEGKHLPVPHCIRGSEGWEIIPQLQEYAAHPIDKPTFGSQYLGSLLRARDEDLRRQGQPGVEKVTFIGVCTDICVISNALLAKAFFAGGGDRGGCRLLCRCDAGESPHGSAGHEGLPDRRGA